MIMQGRPRLFNNSRQISVLVSAEDFKALTQLVQRERVSRPGYSYGDLLRGYIRQCLAKEDVGPLRKLSPVQDRVRRLHALARSAQDIAHELDKR